MFVEPESISIEEAARLLSVSQATIRNWIKAGHLQANSVRPVTLFRSDILKLKNDIKVGKLSRLRTRANKSRSQALHVATDYVGSEAAKALEQLVSNLIEMQPHLGQDSTMFLVCLRVLELRNEFSPSSAKFESVLSDRTLWRRSIVWEEMRSWYASLAVSDPSGLNECYAIIAPLLQDLPAGDILGGIYQSISDAGSRSTSGAFYTPPNLVEDMMRTHSGKFQSFLDPCCGTGQFLLKAAQMEGIPIKSLFGCEKDATAAHICRINLLLQFPDTDVAPNVYCIDTLRDVPPQYALLREGVSLPRVDFIATNPPWGAFKNSETPWQSTYGLRSKEYFSAFLVKSMELLEEGGQLSFVLPEAFLGIKAHSDIREVIVKNSRIERIKLLGRVFSQVFTPVIRIDLVKKKRASDTMVSVETVSTTSQIAQVRFMNNRDYAFDINLNGKDSELLARLDAKASFTLKRNADWALGIVTGNNKKFLKDAEGEGLEAIYKGSDVRKYALGEAQNFIAFLPAEFQQVARTDIYRAKEKLIYKFISTKLAFAYDDKQRLTLNSANIVVPRIADVSAKVVCALLNSDISQFYFRKRYSTHKVIRGDIESLPLPRVSAGAHAQLEKLVDQAIQGEDLDEEINNIIYREYDLNEGDIKYIKSNLLK